MAVIKVLYEGTLDGAVVCQYCKDPKNPLITRSFGKREYGPQVAAALRNTLERISKLGLDMAYEIKDLKDMKGWEKTAVQVVEIKIGATTLRGFGFTDHGQYEYANRPTLVVVRLEKVKSGSNGKASYSRIKDSVVDAVRRAREEYGKGIAWLRDDIRQ